MKQFEEIDSLPRNLKNLCEKFETPDDLSNHLISNEAVFHKTCTNLYNKQKLCRKRKSLDKERENNYDDEEDEVIPEKRVNKKRMLDASAVANNICLFCEKVEESEENLHQCQTFRLNDKIKKIAKELDDHQLLAKFSKGDMIATKAKYHLRCLTDLYNRHRALQSSSMEEDEQKFIEGNRLNKFFSQKVFF